VLKAAREFEAVFLRTLLAPLQKTTQLGGKPSIAAGQSTFGGMVVSAMADSMTNAGGIGLADVVARALSAHGAAQPR
jgi:flagellar protein FlgJ